MPSPENTMTAGKKVVNIRIRRATPADVVNVYRLARLENEQFLPVTLDEGLGVAYLLNLIVKGYVIVADVGGNLVGVLACSAYPPAYSRDFIMDAEVLAAAPSYRQRGVYEALLRNVIQYAKKNDVVLRILLLGSVNAALKESLGKLGLNKPDALTYVLKRKEPDVDAEPDGEQAEF